MKKIGIGVIFLFVIILAYSLFFKKENPQIYLDYISLYRNKRIEFFRNSPDSPFITQKTDFTYLDYFPTNLNLRVKGQFKKSENPDTLALATSTGTIDKFLIFGTANFKLQGIDNILLVLASTKPNDPTLFIPFLDKTSGKTTYGGGRYLDVSRPQGDKIALDFNKAYNPYCAYTAGYTCPFPPKENRLNIAIEAGEKDYSGH